MTRVQTAAASLVAAVPAGILCALLVMVFLNHAENLKTMTQALVGGTLMVTAVVTLLPFGVLIFGGRKAGKAPEKAKAGAAADKADDGMIATSDDIIATDDDLEADEDTETVLYQDAVDDDADTAEVFEDEDFSTTDEEDFALSDDDIEAYEDDDDRK